MKKYPPNFMASRSRLLGLIVLSAIVVQPIFGRLVMSQEPAPTAKTAPVATPTATPVAKPQPKVYKRIPVDGSQKQTRNLISKWQMSGAVPPGQLGTLKTYYSTYVFPQWTHPEYYDEVPADSRKSRTDLRKDLRNDFKRWSGTAIHGELIRLSYKILPKLASGSNYFPVTRYNAMLAIGDLNQQEMKPGVDVIPLPQALPILRKGLTDPNQISPVKIAALIGLRRHAAFGIPATSRVEIIKELLSVVQHPEKTVLEASMNGRIWAQTLAIETLSVMNEPGAQGEVVEAFAQIVAKKNGPLMPRCSAAIALGKTNFAAVKNVKPAELTAALVQLTSDIFSEELRRFEEAKTRERQEADPRDNSVTRFYQREIVYKKKYVSRRRVLASIGAVEKGLSGSDGQKGVRGLAHPEGRPIADALNKLIDDLVKDLAQEEEQEDEEVVDIILEYQGPVTEFLTQLAPVQPPATTPATPAATPPVQPPATTPATPAATPPVTPPATTPATTQP